MRLAEMEVIERERRMVDRRIKAAKFPTVNCLDSFDFAAFPGSQQSIGTVFSASTRRTRKAATGSDSDAANRSAVSRPIASSMNTINVHFGARSSCQGVRAAVDLDQLAETGAAFAYLEHPLLAPAPWAPQPQAYLQLPHGLFRD